MTQLTRSELVEALAQYGYQLNKPIHQYAAEEMLFNLVKENDSRLLEGFPVVYKHLLDSPGYSDGSVKFPSLENELSDKDRKKLLYLLLVSYLLFKLYGEDKRKLEQTENWLSSVSVDWMSVLAEVEPKFKRSEQLEWDGSVFLSTERLKNQYRNYVVDAQSSPSNWPKMDMELELLLSEFFTSKQKELMKKRLSGQALSKTEREYFSRVVNKRLKALANENLHQFVNRVANA